MKTAQHALWAAEAGGAGSRARDGRGMKPVRAGSPCLWLHAGDEDAAAVLSVLAHQLADLPDAPRCLLTGTPDHRGPAQTAEIDAFVQEEAPLALVLAGAPLPPPLIERARANGLGLFLVDAQAPAEGAFPLRLPMLMPPMRRSPLRHFTAIHARDDRAAEALSRRAGRRPIMHVSGAMAQQAPAPPCDRAALEALRASSGGRPAWFAQDLPAREIMAALRAHVHALRLSHRLLLIISQAEDGSAEMLAEGAAELGLSAAWRQHGEEPGETAQLYVADPDDPPGLFLRLAQICYLGGSLTPGASAPSPATAAALGAAIIHGPHGPETDQALRERLRQAGAARSIGSAADLGAAVAHFLQPEALALAALRAWEVASEGSEATERVAHALIEWCKARTTRLTAHDMGAER